MEVNQFHKPVYKRKRLKNGLVVSSEDYNNAPDQA
jgi:hypothetical protein